MNTATSVIRVVIRVLVPIELVLGVLFWSGHLAALTPLHELLGLLLVLGLWALAIVAAIARVAPAVVALAAVYGLVVPVLGELQDAILLGGAHWVVQAVHLLIGVGLLTLAEWLGSLIRRRRAALLGEV